MLKIGHETLYTLTETLDRVRTHLIAHNVDPEGQAVYASVLAVALAESPDFILGAIRPREET